MGRTSDPTTPTPNPYSADPERGAETGAETGAGTAPETPPPPPRLAAVLERARNRWLAAGTKPKVSDRPAAAVRWVGGPVGTHPHQPPLGTSLAARPGHRDPRLRCLGPHLPST